MEKYYKIAGLTVAMDSFGRTVKQAEPYRTDPAEENIQICSDWQTLKQAHPYLSDEDCEYLCTGSSFYRQLILYGGMMLHASAVVVDGKAYLFSADSGTGKSTHTGLWLKLFGDRAYLLNDDKPALRQRDGIWYAYGTPWSGKHDISRNTRAVLGGICFLSRGEKNRISPLSGTKAIFNLLDQTVRPPNAEYRGKILEHLDGLVTHVPIWQMECNMDPAAAVMSYEAMGGELICSN